MEDLVYKGINKLIHPNCLKIKYTQICFYNNNKVLKKSNIKIEYKNRI
jgi:hypothetical protein